MTMSVLVSVLSLGIGLSLGLLGGGGSILTLPMLVYVAHVEPRVAIASSLFVVGVTSASAVVAHASAGAVDFKIGVPFSAVSMVGAYFAGRFIAPHVPANVLLVTFAALMLVTAIAMMRPRQEPTVVASVSMGRLGAIALFVGVISGLIGAGGGFLIVPALSILAALPMRQAVATSLFVITLQSAAGFVGQPVLGQLDWALLGQVSALAVVGSLLGARVSKRVSQAALRKGFAWLVLAMGVLVLAKQVPLAVAASIGVLGAATAVFIARQKQRQT